jgi:hypothetical protein
MQTITYAHDRTHFQCTTYTNFWSIICPGSKCTLQWNSVVIKDRERDVRVQVLQNVKVYFKWGWNKSPFDINSVVFHFDDSNYGRRPYCLSNRIIQFTCNAVNTHLIHRRIFLFSTPCGVGSLLCMRNINCKPHWLAATEFTSNFHKLYKVSPFAPNLNF